MKKFVKIIAALLCAAAVGTMLAGCSSKPRVGVHMTYNGALDALQTVTKDGETPVTYYWAPIAYEPAELMTTPYAEWEGQYLYEVVGWYATRMLSEEFSGVGGLLYTEDVTLPTLSEMTLTSAYVCSNTSVVQAIAIIDDASVLKRCADYLENGETVDLPQDGSFTLNLKFLCEELPGIYYNVLYIEVGDDSLEADHYLYDRSTKRCVAVPRELFYGWLYGEMEMPDA